MAVVRSKEAYGPSATSRPYGWGRNRWFAIRELAVGVYPDGSFSIDVWSKRHGKMPPITFALPKEERRRLIQALRDDLPLAE